MNLEEIKNLKRISPEGVWCVHAYYSLCPYAPDGSGRILFAGTDIKDGSVKLYITSGDGELLRTFGHGFAESNFYHTGSWQTWSSDAKYVYYQSGSMKHPEIYRYEIETDTEIMLQGDMEGAPPFDEPILSGFLGMLYAAGYADGNYYPEQAPIPFQNRDEHGLFRFDVEHQKQSLALSVNQILAMHPCRDEILAQEEKFIRETGHTEGFTLMAYCVRWNADGSRCLFYFGNHCVDKKRGEPKLCYVFTADRDLKELHLALDFSFGKMLGVHWSWHPDGEHLVGYATNPDCPEKLCLTTVRYDGTERKKISNHSSGGHPGISPADYQLAVTDEAGSKGLGRVVFLDLTDDTEAGCYYLPRINGEKEPPGRNRFRVCHHPVFSPDGKKVIVNTLPGDHAVLCELDVIPRKKN